MTKFALEADMEYTQLSKIERGVTNPTLATVISLAQALNVTHSLLFYFQFLSPDKK